MNLVWHIIFAFWENFMIVNGQIIQKYSGYLVTLATDQKLFFSFKLPR